MRTSRNGRLRAGRTTRSERGPEEIEMFLLSVLLMTGWMFAVVTGFAGGFAHLLGLGSVAMIIMKGERRRLHSDSKDLDRPVTI